MALSPRERVLYARHLLLSEIGSTGQERLCAHWVSVAKGADPEAARVATDYLVRAGVTVTGETPGGTNQLDLPDTAAIDALAGCPELAHAAQALRGAFAATEAIKRALDIGTKAEFPTLLCLSAEDV